MRDKIINFLDKIFKIRETVTREIKDAGFEKYSKLHLIDEYSQINKCSSVFTLSMFSPLTAFIICMEKTYGTDNLPIYGFRTNINKINLSEETLTFEIETTQPGYIIGTGGKLIDALTENCKKMFNAKKVEISIKEIETEHYIIDY